MRDRNAFHVDREASHAPKSAGRSVSSKPSVDVQFQAFLRSRGLPGTYDYYLNPKPCDTLWIYTVNPTALYKIAVEDVIKFDEAQGWVT